MKNLKVQEMELAKLRPYERNTKLHDNEQIRNVAASISQYGWQQPIVVDKDLVIIIGHGRYAAANYLGLKTGPVVIADDLTEKQVRELRIIDNKTNESPWDIDMLKLEVADLDFDGFTFDFNLGKYDEDDKDVDEVDFSPLYAPEPTSKPLQIYALGPHRLMCGDSTSQQDVSVLMHGELADLVVTDPPYNVDIESSSKKKIKNDNMAKAEFTEFLTKAFGNLSANLKDGGAFYVWHASRTQREFEDALNANNLYVKEQLIWVKDTFTFGRSDYQWRHEPLFYGHKSGEAHYFTKNRRQDTVLDDTPDIEKMTAAEIKDYLKNLLEYSTVLYEKKPKTDGGHPTMKPVPLIKRLVMNSSRKGELVLDLFGGSGSTLMACHECGRRCYTMEYDPKYVDLILNRWEEETGIEPVLLSK